jgi:DNA-binding response OmpR family regulator
MDQTISILVIDDERVYRELLEKELDLCGFAATFCDNGKEGIKIAKHLAKDGELDVILLDWMMPEMDGLAVLEKLKHTRRTKDIPVFMLTAKRQLSDMDEAYILGADDYITKPFELRQISKIIRRKLERVTSRV